MNDVYKGDKAFVIGDEVAYSCFKILGSDKFAKAGLNVAKWSIYFYDTNDCSGKAYYNVYNLCRGGP